MTLTDQADFVITDTGIHRGPVAWKLATSSPDNRSASRIFSIRIFSHSVRAANIGATPTNQPTERKPIQFDRSAFGDLKPVLNGPDITG